MTSSECETLGVLVINASAEHSSVGDFNSFLITLSCAIILLFVYEARWTKEIVEFAFE